MAVSRIDEAGLNVTQYGNRNLIINGAMQVDQRGGGDFTSGSYSLDRYRIGTTAQELVGTITQDSDAPDGFSNSLKITTTTAEVAIAASDYVTLNQRIEAQNLQQLNYGTSAAKKVTLSFWVKSSVTGVYGTGLYKPDNTAQVQNKSYTINVANTWEYKTLTFDANTLSGGSIDNDTGPGIYVNFHLAAGTDYTTTDASSWINYVSTAWASGHVQNGVITTLNATWQLTGVQLEVGSTATDFEHRSYGDELLKCQRYYSHYYNPGLLPLIRYSQAAGTPYGEFPLPVEMRAAPSFSQSGTWNSALGYAGTPTISSTRTSHFVIASGNGSISAGGSVYLSATANGYMKFEAEI